MTSVPTESPPAVKETTPTPPAVPEPSKPAPTSPPLSTSAAAPSPPTTTDTKPTPATPARKEFPNRQLRQKSGGTPKGKMTPEELEAKMAAMRIQNEKLAKKREETEADEKEYEASRAAELESARKAKVEAAEKKARTVAHQASINSERAKAAAAKLKKVEGRAWDKEKLDNGSTRVKEGGELRPEGEGRNYPSRNARRRSPPPHQQRRNTGERGERDGKGKEEKKVVEEKKE